MLSQNKLNTTDSSAKVVSNQESRSVLKTNNTIDNTAPSTITNIINNDALKSNYNLEKQLFTVPYRCVLNRDSLKYEHRKVILEIDTIPKGIDLILPNFVKDSTQKIDLTYTKSIFSPHLLSLKNREPKPKIVNHENWLFIIFVLVIFLIGILRVFYQKKFTLFLNAFISKRFSNQIIREENALTQSTSVVLSIIFFISISLFLFLASRFYHKTIAGSSEWQKFGIILVGCVIFYFFKLIANKTIGTLFKAYKEIEEYIFNQFLVIQVLGILLTILCILLSYSMIFNKEIIILMGLIILVLGFVVRMIKSFSIVNLNTYSPVYIFLYLCTLEILPLIIIIKLII